MNYFRRRSVYEALRALCHWGTGIALCVAIIGAFAWPNKITIGAAILLALLYVGSVYALIVFFFNEITYGDDE